MGRPRGLVCGVGVNDADYIISTNKKVNGVWKIDWMCPYYDTWKCMLTRCYSLAYLERYPSYADCHVCDEWRYFSNFRNWMEQQDWEGKNLDKDILVRGNKVYSPETCIFVSSLLNNFVLEGRINNNKYMTGVSWDKKNRKFIVFCRNPLTKKVKNLGRFNDEHSAHLAWKSYKHKVACQLADSEHCTDPRLVEALRTRYVD